MSIESLSDSYKKSLGRHIAMARGTSDDPLTVARSAPPLDMLAAVAVEYDTIVARIRPESIDKALVAKFDPANLFQHQFTPISLFQQTLICATTQPWDTSISDLVVKTMGCTVQAVLVTDENLVMIFDHLDIKSSNYSESAKRVTTGNMVDSDKKTVLDLNQATDDQTAWSVCADIFRQCADQGVTDLHLQPDEHGDYIIRAEANGQLVNLPETIPHNVAKTMEFAIYNKTTSMRPDARMYPQDGNISFSYKDRKFDLRIATAPLYIAGGFDAPVHFTIRFQDSRRNSQVTLDSLGFADDVLIKLRKAILTPGSFNVFSGPTGHGKTTTLGACMKFLNKPDVMIYSVEDPVENYYPGINHIQINRATNMTFASVLKSLLRKKPHVIMLAEIRDKETGELAMEAAMTGHTVLTTVHADFSYEVPARLTYAGIRPQQVSQKIELCSSQRLLSVVCPHCSEVRKAKAKECLEYGFDPAKYSDMEMAFHNPSGCSHCKSGYSARRPLLELISMDAQFRALIEQNASTQALENDAKTRLKMKTIFDKANELLIAKDTDMAAIQKIVRV